jgi:hypothetical protein
VQDNLGYNQPSPTPQQAFATPGNQYSEILTLSSPGTLDFGFPDQILYDNQGGVSIAIESLPTQSTPEPAARCW